MKPILYKNKKIKKEYKSRYVEIRELEGCSSRGTGTYEKDWYEIFTVGRLEFEDLKEAKRYIDSLGNKQKIKKSIAKYKKLINTRNNLYKQLDKLYKYIGTLGYNNHKLPWYRD